MAHINYPTQGRRPYIPAGCDQQNRLHDGARAEMPRREAWGPLVVAEMVAGVALSALALHFLLG
jgi:hypothetical protein